MMMDNPPKKIWDFWPYDGGAPVIWREPCPFPVDDADVFEYVLQSEMDTRIRELEAERDSYRLLANTMAERAAKAEARIETLIGPQDTIATLQTDTDID